MASEVVLFDHFPQVLAALHAGAVVGVRNAAKKVLAGATEHCPVDTGCMQASGYIVASDLSTYWQATAKAEGINPHAHLLDEVDHPEDDREAIVAYAANYAVFVHDGTAHLQGRPWLAEELASVNVVEEMGGALRVAIDRAALP